MRGSSCASLRAAFSLFRAVCNVQRAHRELKRHCRTRKREQLLLCLSEAEKALPAGRLQGFLWLYQGGGAEAVFAADQTAG